MMNVAGEKVIGNKMVRCGGWVKLWNCEIIGRSNEREERDA